MMRYLRLRVFVVLVLMLTFSSKVPTQAQESETLQVNVPVEGTLTADTRALSWTFYGFGDQMLSFRAQGSNGLDPVLTIRNQDDQRIIGNDDYDYPVTSDALIEGITIPRSTQYEVIVSAYGDTTGDFVLTMTPGYATFSFDERFVERGDWQAEGLQAQVVDGIATLTATGVFQRSVFVDEAIRAPGRNYTEVIVNNVTGRGGWAVGLAVRYQDADNYYGLWVNEQGQYRVSLIEDGEESIQRDWNPHPAIEAGETAFRVGALVDENTISVFYNGLYIYTVNASALGGGSVGIALLTANAVGSQMTVEVDELFLTEPTQTADGVVFPQELIDAPTSRITVQELIRRGVMPSGGQLAWEIPESFQDSVEPGVSRLPLVQSSTFANFALGATVDLTINRGEGIAACGLLFGNVDDTHYSVAYLDNVGGYGISQRDGDSFDAGLFGRNDSWNAADGADLLLVVSAGTARLFVDQRYVGRTTVSTDAGQVGNVTMNFDPVSSSCQFRNTWAWDLDS